MSFRALLRNHNGFISQFLAVLSATLNAISDGMNYAWSSPMLPRLAKEDSPIKISKDDEAFLEITLFVSGIIGLPLTTYLVDRLGRKQSTLAAACTCIIGWVLIAIADHVMYLYIARFLMGLSSDIAYISSPMYVAEISHKSFRGFLSGTINVMTLVGILIMYIIGPHVDFYVPSVVSCVFLMTQLCSLPFMPDSPYFLIMKGNHEAARKSLKILRATDNIEKEINEIETNIKNRTLEKKGRISDLFRVPSILKAIIIMTMLNVAFHMVGFTVITMNLHYILKTANSTYLDDSTSAIVFAALMLFTGILSIMSVDKFGRKTILILSSILTGTTLATIGIYFHLQVDNDVSSISWIPIVAVMMFAVTFKFGLGIAPIVLTAELFPGNVKAYGMAFSDGIFVIFGSLSIYVYDYLKDHTGGLYTSFYLFACWSFITGLFVILYVPETKGKTLEEVQIMLKK